MRRSTAAGCLLPDDAVRRAHELPKIQPATDFDEASIHCTLEIQRGFHLAIARTAMADDSVKRYPGTNDISAQFSAANIGQTLADYKQIMTSGGDYTFGELTAKFYNLTPDEHQHWKSDVRKYPKDVQDEIKRHIIYALTRVDDQGNEAPIPLSIKWKRSGPKSVTCT